MKKIIFTICFLTCFLDVFSQETPTKQTSTDELIDALLIDETMNDFWAAITNVQFLNIAFTYNSNTFFSGRSIDLDQYNISPQISYMNSKGFYAMLSGVIYSKFNPKWDVTIASMGYGKNFGKDGIFRYFGSATGYLYANNNVDGVYNAAATVGFGVQSKNKAVGTQISGIYYIGHQSTYQFISKSFLKVNLVNRLQYHLTFRPQLSFISGTQLVDAQGFIPQDTLPINVLTPQNITTNSFGLIYTQLNFPLQFSYKSFDIELGYNYNIPSAFPQETAIDNTSFFNIDVSYLINL